ncbi:MAG: CRISPR-associated endonuclease Cas3'' [Thermoanaerobaculia bacterium]
MAYAHSKEGRPKEDWHLLERHLRDTGGRAKEFASKWAAGNWGYLAGLWHDLGKFSENFQRYIGAGDPDAHIEDASKPGRVDHSTAGAVLAKNRFGDNGLPLSLVIAGHHAGLADVQSELVPRLKKLELLEAAVNGGADAGWLDPSQAPELPDRLNELPKSARGKADLTRSYEFWVRFLYSALVDGDFLDTECFYKPGESALRGTPFDLAELRRKLDDHLAGLKAEDTKVNRSRRRILASCREAAKLTPGCFSLTAPTGSGKTLASMAFALRHAAEFGLDRVIVALPFTSVIEQSAAVYRGVFGTRGVVEHHSNVDPVEENHANRLASENWDAPIIVTTTVQFFESLFANRSSACRKLHNVAKSVIILDEAQSIPLHVLSPVLDSLRELVTNFGCTVLISTATQPALGRRQDFPGLENVREIVPDPLVEFQALGGRVRIQWPTDPFTPTAWKSLAENLIQEPGSFLAIVHRRQDARDLVKLLPDDTSHLSASMCAAHRLDRIREIKARLKNKETVRVVSTQLVEAGVDLDFPRVYRAFAGLDAIAQSAGRCNREGTLDEGRLVLFVAPTLPPAGVLRKGFECTKTMLTRHGSNLDPLHPGFFDEYFRSLYQTVDIDSRRIQALRQGLNFRSVAAAFHLIDDDQSVPVVALYGGWESALKAVESDGLNRATLRGLQPYLVQVRHREFRTLERDQAIRLVAGTIHVLRIGYERYYDATLGLTVEPDVPTTV